MVTRQELDALRRRYPDLPWPSGGAPTATSRTPKKENDMPVYMVERGLSGITMAQLAAAQRAAIQTGQQLTAAGKPVRYIRSTFILGEARCLCLFEAPNAQLVEELNDTAKLPYSRIVEALDLTP